MVTKIQSQNQRPKSRWVTSTALIPRPKLFFLLPSSACSYNKLTPQTKPPSSTPTCTQPAHTCDPVKKYYKALDSTSAPASSDSIRLFSLFYRVQRTGSKQNNKNTMVSKVIDLGLRGLQVHQISYSKAPGDSLLTDLQFLWTFLIMALVGNMIHDAYAGNPSIINYDMFVAVFAMLSLFFLIASAFMGLMSDTPVPLALDVLNTLFFFCGAVAMAAELGAHSCNNDVCYNPLSYSFALATTLIPFHTNRPTRAATASRMVPTTEESAAMKLKRSLPSCGSLSPPSQHRASFLP